MHAAAGAAGDGDLQLMMEWRPYGMRKAKGEMERLGKHERACNTDPHLDGESQNGSGRCGGVLPSRRNRLQRRNPPPSR